MKYSMKISLLKRVAIGYTLLIFIPTIVIGLLYYNYVREKTITSYTQDKQQVLTQSCQNVDNVLGQIESLFFSVQNQFTLIRFLDDVNLTPLQQVILYINDFRDILSYLRYSNDYIYQVSIYGQRKNMLNLGAEIRNIKELGDFQFVSDYLSGTWDMIDGEMLVYRRAILDVGLTRTIGLFEVKCDLALLLDNQVVRSKQDEDIYIKYGDNILKYDSKGNIQKQNQIPSTKGFSNSQLLKHVLIEVMLVDKVGSDILGSDKGVMIWLGITTLTMMLLSGTYFISMYLLTRRIQAFAAHIDKSTNGKLHPFHTAKNDEIGILVNAYNGMLERNEQLVHKIQIEQLHQREASFLALQAQVNPHFIYNALETIRMTAELQGALRTSEMIFSLGKLLRYVLSSQVSLVTIREEIEYVNRYLTIQKMRMDDRLNYEIDIPDSLLDTPCPKFILQPLVENAIMHGINKVSDGGFISIKMLNQGDWVCIYICDNGAGLTKDRIDQINSYLAKGERISFNSQKTSIGMDNVNLRMRHVYDGECSMSLSANTVGICVTLAWNALKK